MEVSIETALLVVLVAGAGVDVVAGADGSDGVVKPITHLSCINLT
jgi:hypothetical protein